MLLAQPSMRCRIRQALSDKEIEVIQGFLVYDESRPLLHKVFCDGTPGLFDAHGRLRGTNALEHFFPPALSERVSYVALGKQRGADTDARGHRRLFSGAIER